MTAVVQVGDGPSALAVGARGVWVANAREDTVSRLDPRSGAAVARIAVGHRPTGIAVASGAVWVANSVSGTLSRIDPAAGRVTRTVELGSAPQALAVADGRLWVTVQARPAASAARGGGDTGVLRIEIPPDPGPTDPALDLDVQQQHATCALLLDYPDRPAPAGGALQPDAATATPRLSNDGRTCTFRIRSGLRFSPPSGAPVTAAAFARAIERSLDPRTRSFARRFMRDVVGIRARGNELAVRLAAPAPDLPARLATSYFCAVPPSTPIGPKGVDAIPSAGPYYVASHEADKALVLRRNPGYHEPRPRRFAEIRYAIGAPIAKAVADVKAGRADYVSDQNPFTNADFGDVAPLARRYGPASVAARAGAQQYFETPALALDFFVLNPTGHCSPTPACAAP